jgi:6-phosphogluconolactonase (cycloisomerase 2 family)
MRGLSLGLPGVLLASWIASSLSASAATTVLTAVDLDSAVRSGPPTAVAVSPDGAHAYVAYDATNALGVFSRDAGTGTLTFVAGYGNGQPGVPIDERYDHPSRVVVSPDGANVYVADRFAVRVMARDAGTGELTPVQTVRDGVGGVTTLDRPTDVVVSPDGAQVYTLSASDRAVTAFARNPVTGELTLLQALVDGVGGVDGLASNRNLVISPDGLHLYSGSRDDDAIAILGRDAGTGLLSFIGTQPTVSGGDANGVAISPDGAHLYVTEVSSGMVVYARNAGTGLLTLVGVTPSSISSWTPTVSPDGAHVYLKVGVFSSTLQIYARDGVTGTLTFLEDRFNLGDAFLSPDGSNAYVPVAPAAVLGVFTRDAGTGALTQIQAVDPGVMAGPAVLADVESVAVAPDGAHVYTGGPGALGIFARDAGTGSLTPAGEVREGVGGVTGLGLVEQIALSPDGANLYAASADESSVAVFARDAGTGALAFVEAQVDGVGGADGLAGARGVAVSPDGQFVYASGADDGAVGIFARDPGTGALTFVTTASHPENGRPGRLVVAPDGLSAYEAGPDFGCLVVFDRDPVSGLLAPGVSRCEPGPGIHRGVNDVLVGPDGRHVYAPERSGLAVFARLKEVQLLTDFSDTGRHLAMTPDGAYLFLGNPGAELGAVWVFGRDPGSGRLRLLQLVVDAGTDIAASPDGRNLYGTGTHRLSGVSLHDGTIVSYAIDPCAPFVARSKVVFSRVGSDVVPDNDGLRVSATFLLRYFPFSALDPIADGMSVQLADADGGTVADVTLPGGAFPGGAAAGWKSNARGTSWTWVDRTSSPVGGVKRVVVKDLGKKAPGLVKMTLAARNGSFPIDPAKLPVTGSFALAPADGCALTAFDPADCSAKGSKVSCKAAER